MAWEYKVVPAPAKGLKDKSVKGVEARFAHAVEVLLNEMGAEGWEFWRAETLPSEERVGLTGSQTVWRHLIVFRRSTAEQFDEPIALIEDMASAPARGAAVDDGVDRSEPPLTGDAPEDEIVEVGPYPAAVETVETQDTAPERRD